MDERYIIKKVKEGDQYAFKKLFQKYQDYVFNICYRMTGNRHDAEDTTQDVFIKIFHSIGNFRGDSAVKSWIYRIAVNACLNRERRRKLTSWVSLDFLMNGRTEFQPRDESSSPDINLEQAERERIVQQAIQSLPSRQKTALVLQRYDDLSYQQIAEIMETTTSAVESLIHRAKENLSRKLIDLIE